jgi:thiol-disulfide isomerase/thioredoxin
MIILSALGLAASIAGAPIAQERPQRIAAEKLPEKATCAVCVAYGTMLTEDKVTSGLMYRGKPYYFHSKFMEDAFRKDPEAFAPPILPRKVHPFDLKDTTGKVWNQTSFAGRAVIVTFWASWSEPSTQMFPILKELRAAHPTLDILAVSIDTKRSDLDEFLHGKSFDYPILHDTKKTFSKWHVIAIPAIFLVKNGEIIAQWSGVASREMIEKAINWVE